MLGALAAAGSVPHFTVAAAQVDTANNSNARTFTFSLPEAPNAEMIIVAAWIGDFASTMPTSDITFDGNNAGGISFGAQNSNGADCIAAQATYVVSGLGLSGSSFDVVIDTGGTMDGVACTVILLGRRDETVGDDDNVSGFASDPNTTGANSAAGSPGVADLEANGWVLANLISTAGSDTDQLGGTFNSEDCLDLVDAHNSTNSWYYWLGFLNPSADADDAAMTLNGNGNGWAGTWNSWGNTN